MGMQQERRVVSFGSQVEIELTDRAGNKERLSFVIVPDDVADFAHGLLSEKTALAKAVLGERIGTPIPYLKDDILSIQVLAISASATQPSEDAAQKRQADALKAARAVQDTNAMVFASSFSGKWGDYDPDSIPKEKPPEK